jgi:dTDP-4-dehydrorhamnose 3,5-epimerase
MKSIEGLHIIPLKKILNERGYLLEIQRNDDLHYRGFGQLYLTCTLPGVVKAWYRHQKQLDQITLVRGELAFVLYDGREDSPTYHNILEIILTDQEPVLIQTPPGIWHGFKALGNEPAQLLHLNSTAFDFEHTDEDRLPPDSQTIPYKW